MNLINKFNTNTIKKNLINYVENCDLCLICYTGLNKDITDKICKKYDICEECHKYALNNYGLTTILKNIKLYDEVDFKKYNLNIYIDKEDD